MNFNFKFIELELDLCIRLSLNNIRHFKLTLKELVQLILGTNGSGKSSILYELSPLPASPKDYHKGGRKRQLISNNGKMYELISDFSNGQDHYFYVDGENLNEQRTITIQKELVKEHFGYTFEIHDIMLGLEPFTTMSPARRREVFTMLCSVDYSYAIKLYKKILEAHTESKNAAKLTKRRLVEATSSTLGEEEITALRNRLNELNRESTSMYLLRNADALSVRDAKISSQQAINTIIELTSKFHAVRKIVRDKCYISPEEYQIDIDSVRDELSQLEGVYGRLAEEFMTSSVEVNSVSDLEGEDIAKLKDTIIADNEKAKELLERRKRPLEGFNAVRANDSMELVYDTLQSVLTELPSDPDGLMSAANFTEVMNKLRDLELSLSTNKEKLSGLVHHEKHLAALANSEQINCPSCDHKWHAGYTPEAHMAVKGRIEKGREIVDTLVKDIAKFQEEREKLQAYSVLYKDYVRITRNTPELQPLWTLISEEDSVRTSPKHALTLVELVRSDLRIEMQVQAIREKINLDMKRLELAEYAQSETIKGKKVRLEKLEQEIGRLSQQKVIVQNKLYELINTQRQVKQMYTITDAINAAKDTLNQTSIKVVNAVKNEIIDSALVETHREIATLNTRIHSIDQHEATIVELKNAVSTWEKSEKAYKALAETLSPTDGLIAEGMLGFIRSYVAKMNALIAKVWTYRMEVHDCSTDSQSAELNYKFPLSTPNLPRPVEDVKFGSTAQQEMVNLGYRVIAAQSWGLDRGPLALDEFGAGFDEAHRDAATQVIRQLMEQLNFSQLFMISHYESCYGAFYNAQVTVLDKRNITTPGGKSYNEHTLIEA